MKTVLRTLVSALLWSLLYNTVVASETEKPSATSPAKPKAIQLADQKAITQAVLDYVEGWYTSDEKRMNRALSEHLVKRRITPEGEVMAVDKEWMVRETGNGRGQVEQPDKARKDITIFAQTDSIANVMLLSEQYVDYLHLVKTDGAWKIVNALWEFH